MEAVEIICAEVRDLIRVRGIDPRSDARPTADLIDEVIRSYDERILSDPSPPPAGGCGRGPPQRPGRPDRVRRDPAVSSCSDTACCLCSGPEARGVCDCEPKHSDFQIFTARELIKRGVAKAAVARELGVRQQTLYTVLKCERSYDAGPIAEGEEQQ